MKEQWREIEEFPLYAISDRGRVMNQQTELIKVASLNQGGTPNVLLTRGKYQTRRSVALLVADRFLPPPPRESFDTPINLDGDRTNNAVTNLMWRPRWFAVAYNQQWQHPMPFGYVNKIRDTTDGVVYTVDDCARQYGLLMKEIIMSIWNNAPVFPTWQVFEEVE